MELNQSTNNEKEILKSEDSLRDLWGDIKWPKTRLLGSPEGDFFLIFVSIIIFSFIFRSFIFRVLIYLLITWHVPLHAHWSVCLHLKGFMHIWSRLFGFFLLCTCSWLWAHCLILIVVWLVHIRKVFLSTTVLLKL